MHLAQRRSQEFSCEPNLGVPPGPPPRWLRHCMCVACVACVAFGWKHARALEKVHAAPRLQFSDNDWTDRDSLFSHASCSTNMADRMSRRASGQYRRLAHALVFQPFLPRPPNFCCQEGDVPAIKILLKNTKPVHVYCDFFPRHLLKSV